MPTFEEPNDKMRAAFEHERARDVHRDRLASVNIQLIAAEASRDKDDEPRGEALASGGRPILGKVRIMSLEDRAAAVARGEEAVDVRIILNGDRWGATSTQMQYSALDHLLTRIEVLLEDGRPKLDDAGRPKLRLRRPDYTIEGFVEVAERHGKHSIEVHEIRVLLNEHGQVYMPWLEDREPIDNAVFAARPKAAKPVSGKGGKKAAALDGATSITVDGRYQLGALKPKPLALRIVHIKRPETILGIAALEFQTGKPRKGVMTAIRESALALGIIEDLRAVETGAESRVEPDLAAAVLVTSPANLDPAVLEQLVPECRDSTVLEWVMDDEQNRDDQGRDFVIEVVQGRLDQVRAGEHVVH